MWASNFPMKIATVGKDTKCFMTGCGDLTNERVSIQYETALEEHGDSTNLRRLANVLRNVSDTMQSVMAGQHKLVNAF
jgi:hypothetical protein